MPVYEYRCGQCRHKMTIFVRSISSAPPPVCEHCGGENVNRVFSTFAVRQSSSREMDGPDDASLGGIDESDPRAMARMLRNMGSESGEEMGPEFDEMVGRMEAGESVEDIEASLGADDSGDGLRGDGPEQDNF